MFMTSRESAIVFEPFSAALRRVAFAIQPLSSEELLAQTTFERIQVSRAYISPETTPGEGRVPRFTGFYACFLANNRKWPRAGLYIVYDTNLLPQQDVGDVRSRLPLCVNRN